MIPEFYPALSTSDPIELELEEVVKIV